LTRYDRHACCAAHRALPGLHAAEHDIVAADETLTVRYVVEATHQGEPLGALLTFVSAPGLTAAETAGARPPGGELARAVPL
jgi:hypothetical protein